MQLRRSRSAFTLLVSALTLSLTLALSAISAFAERIEDLPKPTTWVVDFAHVLSPDTVARLDSLCGQLSHSKTNAQLEVVTVQTLDGDDVSDFANRLEERWKIGRKGSDRGILILLAVKDHKRWIEVGYGLEGILPDAKVGDIGRSMVPALRASDYNRAVTTGVLQIANVIAADAKVSLQDSDQDQAARSPYTREPRREVRHSSPIGLIFRIVIIVLVLLFLGARGLFGFGLGMLFGGGGRWGGGGGGWGGGDGGGGGGGFDGSGGGESGGGGAGGDW
jgi:uncharacterized protein